MVRGARRVTERLLFQTPVSDFYSIDRCEATIYEINRISRQRHAICSHLRESRFTSVVRRELNT